MLLVIMAASLLGSSQAAALPAQGSRSDDGLVLVAQTPFVETDGTFTMRIDLGPLAPTVQEPEAQEDAAEAEPPAADEADGVEPVEVVVTVFTQITASEQLDEEPTDPINRLSPQTLDEATIDEDGVLTVRMPVREGQAFDEIERVRLPDPGVYPVTVELQQGEETLGSVRSNLIHLPDPSTTDGDEAAEDDNPATRQPPLSLVVDLTNPEGTALNDVAALLAEHPALDLTIVLGAELLTELQQDETLSATFASAVGSRPVVAIGEPDLDPSSLIAIDQAALYQTSVEALWASLEAEGLNADRTTIAIGAPQTADGARALAGLDISIAIDTSSFADAPNSATDTNGSVRIGAPGVPLAVLGIDQLSFELQNPATNPAQRVQRLLAGLTLDDGGRPIVLGLHSSDETGIQTLEQLLDALEQDVAAVEPLASTALTVAVEPGAATTPVDDFTDLADKVERAQDRLNTYETFYLDGPNSPEAYRNDIDEALALGRDDDTRVEIIDALNEQLGAELAVISLPENQSVTLAARSALIPLTILNTANGAREVRLQFLSDKIVVAEDGQLIMVEPGRSSIDIQVEARSLGASPLQVLLLSPDGKQTLSTTRFQVRSTAVPGIGLLISAVGLILLGVWWYLSIRRNRSGHPSKSGHDAAEVSLREADHDRDRALAGDSV